MYLLFSCDDADQPCSKYSLAATEDIWQNEENLVLSYDADGLLRTVSGPYAQVSKYHYDASRTLIKVEQAQDTFLFAYDAKHRLISIYQERFIDSVVFSYDEANRIATTQIYRVSPDLLYYFNIEYPDSKTIKKYTYYRDPITSNFEHKETTTYTMDENPRPYPEAYCLYLLGDEDVVLPHNPLSIDYFKGDVLTFKQIFTYRYNAGKYPISQKETRSLSAGAEPDTYNYSYACE